MCRQRPLHLHSDSPPAACMQRWAARGQADTFSRRRAGSACASPGHASPASACPRPLQPARPSRPGGAASAAAAPLHPPLRSHPPPAGSSEGAAQRSCNPLPPWPQRPRAPRRPRPRSRGTRALPPSQPGLSPFATARTPPPQLRCWRLRCLAGPSACPRTAATKSCARFRTSSPPSEVGD